MNTESEPQTDETEEQEVPIHPEAGMQLLSMALQKRHPEDWKALPEVVKQKLHQGDPTGLVDLLKEKPEAFRNPLLQHHEDTAWEHHLSNPEPSQPQ